MSPNVSTLSNAYDDPTWATVFDDPNRPGIAALWTRTHYRQGLVNRKARSEAVAAKFAEIGAGLAANEPQEITPPGTTNQQAIDFDAPHGMIAAVAQKAKMLPTEGVFMPLVSGLGVLDNPAVTSWKLDSTITTKSAFRQSLTRGLTL